jgi:thiamine pyrophosphate-dependent acetolactate synthase large subunit-like protein
MTEKYEKMLTDLDKPGAEEALLAPPPTAVAEWLEQEVDVFDLAAEMLKEEGVKCTFGVCAGGAWNIEGHSLRAGIPRVHVRTEETATYAADAYGRMLQRPGVAITGPATGINYATAGVVQAYSAQSPMVYIAGESGVWDDDKFMLQGVTRTEDACRGISKWARRCPNPATFLFQLKRAFRDAVTAPTGPCCVAYPYEYSNRVLTIGPRRLFLMHYTPGTWAPKPRRSLADPEDIKRMMEWLLASERPAVIAGEGVVYDDAIPELQEFVALTGIPTHCRRNARGAISEFDPLNCYGRARGVVMRECDRGVLIGLRCGGLEWFGYPPFFGQQATYAQIQTHVSNTALSLPTEHELIGNLKLTLREMINILKEMGVKSPPEKWNSWRQRIAQVKEEYDKRVLKRTEPMRGKVPVHPDLMGREISEFLHEELHDEYYSIIDGWTAATYYSDWIKVKFAPSVLDASDTITFGHGPGMALGCHMAVRGTDREKPIIAIIGDGAIGATGMDIETCVRWEVPCLFVHMNNNQIAGGQEHFFKDVVWKATGIREKDGPFVTNWIRYDRMMAEFGIHTEFANRDDQIKPALKRCFDYIRTQGKPAFLEVHVDEDVMQEIWPTICATMSVGWVKWDELSDHAKGIIRSWSKAVSSLTRGWARKDWFDALEWPYDPRMFV